MSNLLITAAAHQATPYNYKEATQRVEALLYCVPIVTMGASIVAGTEVWFSTGWMYRFVMNRIRPAITSTEGLDELQWAEMFKILDLYDLPEGDLVSVRGLLGPELITAFEKDLLPDYDARAAIASLEELVAMVGRMADEI